ncbi:MAG: hypothetical protein AB7K08_13890 [Microbacteriaceae bacterium]
MTSTSALTGTRGTATLGRRALAGVIGGVAGGIMFGILMAMMGMLPVIASMVGSTSPVVGFIIHIGMSIMIGLGLTVLFGNLLLTSYPRGLVVGMGYGAVWWVLGPLMVMPMMFGMPLFAIDTTALFSLMGHLIYGAILGIVAVRILKHRRG